MSGVRGPWWTPRAHGAYRRICIDDEKKALSKALDDAELEYNDAIRAVERGRKRFKRTKQKRLKLLALGKLNFERLRNFVDARIDERERELKAAKVKWRAAWALRDERCEELDDFEQYLLDDGTHDAAGIQVLFAAEVAPFGYCTRDKLGLRALQQKGD